MCDPKVQTSQLMCESTTHLFKSAADAVPKKYVNHLSLQYYVTTMVTAALLGAALISMSAASENASYACTKSTGVCGVALVHYWAIMSVRKKQWQNQTFPLRPARDIDDYMVAVLRHSDWSVRRHILFKNSRCTQLV